MARGLGYFEQWWGGEWADRNAINRNAEELTWVEGDLTNLTNRISRLQDQIRAQHEEVLRLRAMFMGVVELLHAKTPFDDAELQIAVQHAWAKLVPPPPAPTIHTPAPGGDPYRDPPAAAPAARIQQMATCVRCGEDVLLARTTITVNGTVCDRCA